MKQRMKGLFITFEGIEGSGKSTQMELLARKLEELGLPCLLTREPGGPPIAEHIRQLLLDPLHCEMLPETELLLYSASRVQHTGEWILPALRLGKIVLCDRYYDSTFAYQGAARSQNLDFIRLLTAFATFNTADRSFESFLCNRSLESILCSTDLSIQRGTLPAADHPARYPDPKPDGYEHAG